MNVEIRTPIFLFWEYLFWEYLFRNFGILSLQCGMGERAKEAIISAMGLSFIPLYRFMGPLAMPILFLIFIWGTVRLGVFWSLPFQLIITPFRRAGRTPPY